MRSYRLKKEASAAEVIRQAVEAGKRLAQANKPELIGAGAGALLATGLGALTVKRWDKGSKPSLLERDAEAMQGAQEREKRLLRSKGKQPGYAHKMQDAVSKAYSGMAKAMAEHPVAGSLTYGASGARLGFDLGRMTRNWK